MLTDREIAPPALESDYFSAGDPPSKRRILKEALHLFAERGIDGVTVREIGDRAGYTNAALFKFFPGKDALALYLFEQCYLALFESVSAVVRGEMPFEQQFHGIVGAAVAAMDRDLDAFLFVQDQLRSMWPRVAPRIRKRSILALIRSTLEQGTREKKVDPAANLNLLIAVITGTLQQFARMRSFGEFRGPAAGCVHDLEAILLRSISA
jgi:TetR/AcrR family transcriptional regulator, repressor of fatR-cypB operon